MTSFRCQGVWGSRTLVKTTVTEFVPQGAYDEQNNFWKMYQNVENQDYSEHHKIDVKMLIKL